MSFHNSIKAALLGLAALGLAAAAASADQLADIKAAGKITTATDMHYAPFDMLIDGVYQGMTKDLFDEVAKEIGVEPVYQDLPWTAQLPGLEVGKFDIVIAPVTITPERLERYTFTLPDRRRHRRARQGRLQRRDQEARGHRRQDRRRPAGHGAVPPARRPTARSSAASTSRSTAPPTRPMPTSPSAVSTPSPARSPNLAYLVKQRGDAFALLEPATFGEPKYFAWVLQKGENSASFAQAINDALAEDDRRRPRQGDPGEVARLLHRAAPRSPGQLTIARRRGVAPPASRLPPTRERPCFPSTPSCDSFGPLVLRGPLHAPDLGPRHRPRAGDRRADLRRPPVALARRSGGSPRSGSASCAGCRCSCSSSSSTTCCR